MCRLLFCLGYSLAYCYEEVNRTHCNVCLAQLVRAATYIARHPSTTSLVCQVPNAIPSISSTVGQYSPQIYVWRAAVCLMMGQRALDVIAYHRLYAVCDSQLQNDKWALSDPRYVWHGSDTMGA